MREQTPVSYPIPGVRRAQIEGFDPLAELALNLRWSWNHATDEVWRQLDPKLWKITHNPWVVLQTDSRDRIKRVLISHVSFGDPYGIRLYSAHHTALCVCLGSPGSRFHTVAAVNQPN